MPTWFVNTFGWGMALGLIVIAYVLSKLPWPGASRANELSPSPAILDAFTDRNRMEGDRHLSHWSDTALRTPALDQDFSYRALAEGTAGSTGRHAEAPAAGTGTAPWSSGTTSSTTGSQEDPR